MWRRGVGRRAPQGRERDADELGERYPGLFLQPFGPAAVDTTATEEPDPPEELPPAAQRTMSRRRGPAACFLVYCGCTFGLRSTDANRTEASDVRQGARNASSVNGASHRHTSPHEDGSCRPWCRSRCAVLAFSRRCGVRGPRLSARRVPVRQRPDTHFSACAHGLVLPHEPPQPRVRGMVTPTSTGGTANAVVGDESSRRLGTGRTRATTATSSGSSAEPGSRRPAMAPRLCPTRSAARGATASSSTSTGRKAQGSQLIPKQASTSSGGPSCAYA